MKHRCGLVLITLMAAATMEEIAYADQDTVFEQLDSNRDGYLEFAEIGDEGLSLYHRLLRTSDTNQDGRLSVTEFSQGTTRQQREGVQFDTLRDEGKNSKKQRDKKAQRGARFQQIFERMDTNQDRQLTANEIPPARRQRFELILQQLDEDEDGAVTQSQFVEFLSNRQRPKQKRLKDRKPNFDSQRRNKTRTKRRRPSLNRLMEILDGDGDGNLSKSEIADASSALLNLDKDGDGTLSPQEIKRGPKRGDFDKARNRSRRD